MGAWGYGIRQDDYVCDVIADFENLMKAGNDVATATKSLQTRFASELNDPDDGPLFWIALADVQWTHGKLEPRVLKKVKDDLDAERSLTQWQEDQRGLSRRRTALVKFIEKIEHPNPRPKRPPKIVVRPPKFRKGDCLSIEVSDGKYGAGIVLATDHSDLENGMDFVAILDYYSSTKPSMEVFQKRKWLYLTHHKWGNKLECGWFLSHGFRAMKHRLEVVGEVPILASDPKPIMEGVKLAGWTDIGDQVVRQREWDNRNC